MKRRHSFKFVDDRLNAKLIALLDQKAKGRFTVGKDGLLRYSHDDEDLIGNELICAVRAGVFGAWQIISCPSHWADSYKRYMHDHKIQFTEEIRDDHLRFLISRNFHPHTWKLTEPSVSSSR